MRTRDPKKEASIRSHALKLIVKEGFDGLSMHKLAKAARVSPATIYIYFQDREDLILQVYAEVNARMVAHTLKDFSPELPFDEGLRLQWVNRANYFLKYPQEMHFLEQVRYSPLHERAVVASKGIFQETMKAWVANAIRRGELVQVPLEVYWSVAFAPLYQLVKFHMHGKGLGGTGSFRLDDSSLLLTLDLVLKALKP